MNLQDLQKLLKPKLHKIDFHGMELYIHRPSSADFDKCTDAKMTLIHCVKDENGDPIFTDGEIQGRIDVNSIDAMYVGELNQKVIELWTSEASSQVEDLEKK
ncbi:TPA: hypothetical protein I9774_000405 [Serratia marcescens]|nr:hypothetical protein [Serratia marcescens]